LKKFVLIFTMAVLMTSCAHHLAGKKLNSSYCIPLTEKEKFHSVKYQNSSFLVKHSIDEENNSITFDGKLFFYRNVGGGSKVLEVKIEFIFCDENYVAVASNQTNLWGMEKDKPMPFNKTFKYDKRYEYVFLSWYGKVD